MFKGIIWSFRCCLMVPWKLNYSFSPAFTLELQKALSMSPDREHEPSTSVTWAQGVPFTKLTLHTSLPNKSSNFPWRPLVPNLPICTHSLTNTPPWPQPSLDCTKPPLCNTMVATPFPFPLYPLVWSTHNCPLFTVACIICCLNFLILLICFTYYLIMTVISSFLLYQLRH